MEGRRETSDIIDQQAGVIPRSIYHIFQTLESNKTEYTIKVSCMELYNEELQDLLTDRQNKLKIFDDNSGRKGTVVSGLEEIVVQDASHIITILEEAQKRRQIAETNLNKSSSRSHCITTITIHMREVNDEGEEFIKTGKLNLVDLAGSENIGRSGAVKQRAKEAGMINQSLLTLGRVITALTEHSPHVPYRESKLTRILQDSLGGRTKTCLIATVSPSIMCLEETLSTLDYAHKAKSIKNKPEVNMKVSKSQLIKEMSSDMEKLKAELNAQRLKNGIYLSPEAFEENNRKIQEQESTIRDLEDQLQLKVKEFEELATFFKAKERELQQEIFNHTETKTVLSITKNTLQKTENDLILTKDELGKTTFILEKTEENEVELLREAHYLLDNLKESMSDVDGFLSKVERKSKVEHENLSLTQQFKNIMSDKMEQSEQDIRQLKNIFDAINGSAKCSIDEFIENKSSNSRLLSQQINDMTNCFTHSQKELYDMVEQRCLAHSDSLSNLSQTNEAFEMSMVKALSTMKSVFEMSVNIIQQQVDSQSKEIVQLNNYFIDTLTRNTKYMEAFTTKQTEVMTDLSQQIEKTAEQHVKQTNEHTQKLKEMFDKQKKSNSILKQELLRNVETMIDSAICKQENDFGQSVTGIQQFFGESIQSVQSMDTSIKAGAETTSSNMERLKANMSTNQQDALQSVTKSRLNLEASLNTVSSQATMLTTDFNNFFNHSNTSVTTNTRNLHSHIDNSNAALVVFKDGFSAASSKNSSTYQELTAQLQSQNLSFSSSLDQFIEKQTSIHNTQLETVEEFKTKFINEKVNDMKRSLDNFVLNTDKSTGSTPQKKKRKLPEALSKTKPREELVEMYRITMPPNVEKEQVVQSPPLEDAMLDETSEADTVSTNSNKENIDETLASVVIPPPIKKEKVVLAPNATGVTKKKPTTQKPGITKVLRTTNSRNEHLGGVSSFR